MSVIYLLICVSTLVAGLFFILCIMAIKKGQYEDIESPSVRMLFEDELVENQENTETKKENKNRNKT